MECYPPEIIDYLHAKRQYKIATADMQGDPIFIMTDDLGNWGMYMIAPNGSICLLSSGDDMFMMLPPNA